MDYQLILPKKELEEVLTNEIRKFGEEKKVKKNKFFEFYLVVRVEFSIFAVSI